MSRRGIALFVSVAAVGAFIFALAVPASASHFICFGEPNDDGYGTPSGDVIPPDGTGDPLFLPNVIATGFGQDVVHADGGKDRVCGGPGGDSLFGQSGADRLKGDGGQDLVSGGFGPDILKGGAGNDELRGGPGFDRANGGTGFDVCFAEVEVNCEA